MIPKQIFFLWFGDNVPKYCEFNINNFKLLHPDWSVNYIHYSKYQLENVNTTDDECLIKSDEYVRNRCSLFLNKKRCYIGNMIDYYRYLLINKYGGFYCDLDMFFYRKIPDIILNCDKVQCTIMYDTYTIFPESGFFGCVKDYKKIKSLNLKRLIPCGNFVDDDFYNRRKKFLKCELNQDDYNSIRNLNGINRYLFMEHFGMCSWNGKNKELINKDIMK